MCLDGRGESGCQGFRGSHATTALDDHGILGDGVLRLRVARQDFELELQSGVLRDEFGEFDPTDVLASHIMGAGFEEQDTVAIVEMVDLRSTLEVVPEEAFASGEDHAEGGEEDRLRDEGGDLVVDLAIGDDETRRLLERRQRLWELVGLTGLCNSVVVEDVADELDLRKDETALRRGGVDGSYEQDDVVGSDDIAKKSGMLVGRGRERLPDKREDLRAIAGVEDREWEYAEGKGVFEVAEEVGTGGIAVDLGVKEEDGDIVFPATGDKILLDRVERIVGDENDGEVHLRERSVGAADAERAEGAQVVDAGGVDPDHGAYARDFHRLTDRVGGSAGGVGDDGDRLVGEVVDERAFAIITSTKDAYMRFKFVALHGRSNVKFFIFFYFHIIKLHFLSFIISFE